jgi:hypothetical protein
MMVGHIPVARLEKGFNGLREYIVGLLSMSTEKMLLD